jgi:DNA-binding CsgD family transcriptional regulator
MRPRMSVRRLAPLEHKIALLVADGLTISAIAGQLGLTPGTVTVYVQRIKRRLKLTSRAEIAAWVIARRNPDDPQARLRRVSRDRPA